MIHPVGDQPMTSDSSPKRVPRRGIYLLPNLLTTGALFTGFYSIVAAIDGNFLGAAWAIYIAMFLDGLDGRVARMTSTESDFGKEFDSLADMVSFGLAPAIVTYQWGVERFSEYGALWGRLGWLAAFLYTVAAAFRLARFNTSLGIDDKRYFQGLPSPPAASGIAAMVWISIAYEIHGLFALVCGIAITALTGLAMMSNFRYLSFKDFNLGSRVRFTNLLLIPLVLITIALNPPLVLFTLFFVYATSAPVHWLWRHRGRTARRGAREQRP
jgi:CDP-diacylglycerol--serine O-phosphatidyltransferase